MNSTSPGIRRLVTVLFLAGSLAAGCASSEPDESPDPQSPVALPQDLAPGDPVDARVPEIDVASEVPETSGAMEERTPPEESRTEMRMQATGSGRSGVANDERLGNEPPFVGNTSRPSVVSVLPANNATSVSTGTDIQMVYDLPMNATSACNAVSVFLDSNGASVIGTASYNGTTRTVTFDPANVLPPNARIRVVLDVARATNGSRTRAPNAHWSFTTGS